MPQIDFGKAFAITDIVVPRVAASLPDAPLVAQDFHESTRRALASARLGRSEWTNISFVVLALTGGLFCAFYFFNGAELVRAAAAWPRELLYSRPYAKLVNPAPNEDLVAANQADPGDPTASLDGRRPFGSHVGNIAPVAAASSLASPLVSSSGAGTLGTSGGPITPGGAGLPGIPGGIPSVPSPDSLLGQLLNPLPGGDALTRTLHKGAADLQRANAARTVVVVQTRVARSSRRLGAIAGKSAAGANNAAAKAVNGATGTVSSGKAGANNANNLNRTNAGQAAMGGLGRNVGPGGLGGLGGLGRGSGLVGFGGGGFGFGGGSAGGIGGTIGGIGRGVGLGGGGRH